MDTLNIDQVRTHLRAAVGEEGKNLRQISRDAKVDYASLWRFLNKDGYSISARTLEKLWPVLYGHCNSKI